MQPLTPTSRTGTGSRSATWDNAAASYDTLRQSDPVYASCIRLAADAIPRSAQLCLDAGCGTGLSTAFIVQEERLVIAVDFSLESLKSLRKKGMRNVLVVQADLTALPFKDSIFDACLCANTLQHLRPGDPQRLAVGQLVSATKDGGFVSVSVHHFSRYKQRAGWLKEGKPGQPGIDYIYRFTRQNLHELLPRSTIRGAGFYALLRIPVFGAKIQYVFARAFGIIAARLGLGHMLIAVLRRPGRPTALRDS